MNSVFFVVPFADVTGIGYFLIDAVTKNEVEWNQKDFSNKEWNQELDFWSRPTLFRIYALFESLQS